MRLSFCIFENFLGIPCPSCNMTTAFYFLLHGDLVRSFYFHPFLIPTILAFILIVIFTVKYHCINNKVNNKVIKWWIIGLLIIYIIRMIWIFPSFPMLFNEKAVLPQFLANIF